MCSQPRVTTFAQQKRGVTKNVKKEDLALYFDRPIENVANVFGVSTTIIKRLCRKHGINKWPYRQVWLRPASSSAPPHTRFICSPDSRDFKCMLSNIFLLYMLGPLHR